MALVSADQLLLFSLYHFSACTFLLDSYKETCCCVEKPQWLCYSMAGMRYRYSSEHGERGRCNWNLGGGSMADLAKNKKMKERQKEKRKGN